MKNAVSRRISMLNSRIPICYSSPGAVKFFTLILLLALMLPGCKGNGAGPITPDESSGVNPASDQQLTGQVQPSVDSGKPNKVLWGVWDVTLDREHGLVAVPVRGAQYTLNVNNFMQPPIGKLNTVTFDVVNMEKLFNAGDVVVDVTLNHPFPALTRFTGFDVMGVFMGKGDYIAGSDSGIRYGRPGVNAILRNADGYTRWMNQSEFTSKGIGGYTEGVYGNKWGYWNSTLNPYKYFCNGLYSTENVADHFKSGGYVAERGAFLCGTSNTRRYDLHFSMASGYPEVKFQYAVVASWTEPLHNPPNSVPGDFPAAANMRETFYCDISTVGSTLYWNDMYDNGGKLFLTLEVFNWSYGSPSGVAGDIQQIILDSPDEFINGGTKLVFDPPSWTVMAGGSANSIKIALDVGDVKLGGPCPFDNDVLITIVKKGNANYDNGIGSAYPTSAVLSGYARLFYDLGKICNDPPKVWFENCPTSALTVANRTFRWTAEDDVTPNAKLEYRYKYDNGAWSAWTQGLKNAYVENMTEAEHTVYVECRDMDGQVSQTQCTFTVDLPPVHMPPNVDFTDCDTYVHSTTRTFHLDLSDDFTPISKLKVRYNYDSTGWVTLPDGSTQITLNGITSGFLHSLLVEIEDLDLMIDQAQCDFSLNLAPSVLILNCPAIDLNVNTYQFDWSGSDPEGDVIEYQTQLDSDPWSAWGPATSLVLNGLASGNHTFRVRVRDTFGGQDQTLCNFSVNFGPSIQIDNKPSQDVNTPSYQFTWTASDDRDSPLTMQYNVQLDGVWQGWQVGIPNYTWNLLPSGTRTFIVRVRDTGNPQLWAEDSCNFDVNYKPSVNITCPGGVWPSQDITMNWVGVDDNTPSAGMTYQWKMDSDPWSAWSLGTLSQAYTGLSEGDHTFSVKCRDTGTPTLQCDTAPDTCDTCNFTIDSSCAFPPPDIQNFVATKALGSLNPREVRLTWDPLPGCVDFYDIERYNYVTGTGWVWEPLQSVAFPTTQWIDTDARYSGTADPISYRAKARNISGMSPTWQVDTGYPILRNIKSYMWCWAQDSSGTGATTTWARGLADHNDTNTFWNQYGLNLVSQNMGDFGYMDNPAYQDLTGGENGMMKGEYSMPNTLNIYYVTTSNGSYNTAYCMCYCPGAAHNLNNMYIVQCRDTRGVPPNERPIVLAHEVGHGYARLYDVYLLDTNGDWFRDTTCAAQNTWCVGGPPLFCDDNACYPEPGDPAIPQQLMWKDPNVPVANFDIMESQWLWVEEWVHGYEACYPWP
jgi:hypothetical protein